MTTRKMIVIVLLLMVGLILWLPWHTEDAAVSADRIRITDSKLETFNDLEAFGFGFSVLEEVTPPDRVTYYDYVSPYYDPFNYTMGIQLLDGSWIHAHLPNIRLVTTDSDEAGRYMLLEDGNYYVEMNMMPQTFEVLIGEEFFDNCDQYQIAFIQQMLSDTYIDLRKEVSESDG